MATGPTGRKWLAFGRGACPCSPAFREVVQALVDAAHQIRPNSKATRGNIDITIELV
jgi:organic hydroperoxide reductase OsmC/OhrA